MERYVRTPGRTIDPACPTAVVWDLDSVLADTRARQHLVPKVKSGLLTWEDYALACGSDVPFPAAAALLALLWPHHLQVILTNRSDAARAATRDWIYMHGLQVDRLIMRPAVQARECVIEAEAYQWKVAELDALKSEGIEVELYIEDWPAAAEYISNRSEIPVLTVNPCYPDDPHSSRPSLTGMAGI